jgi:amino acid transporter
MSLTLYLIMLVSVIRLRRIRPTTRRPYRIPGGKAGLFAVCGVGGLVCLLGVLLSLFPTDDAKGMPVWLYEIVLLGGTLGFAVLPFVFYLFRKPSWKTEPAATAPVEEERIEEPV